MRRWQIRLAMILIPAVSYLMLALSVPYPKTERATSNVSTAEMWGQTARPLFLILFVCMWMTAAVEIGPDQWFPTGDGRHGAAAQSGGRQRRALPRLYRRADVRASHVGKRRDPQVSARHAYRQLDARRHRAVLARSAG